MNKDLIKTIVIRTLGSIVVSGSLFIINGCNDEDAKLNSFIENNKQSSEIVVKDTRTYKEYPTLLGNYLRGNTKYFNHTFDNKFEYILAEICYPQFKQKANNVFLHGGELFNTDRFLKKCMISYSYILKEPIESEKVKRERREAKLEKRKKECSNFIGNAFITSSGVEERLKETYSSQAFYTFIEKYNVEDCLDKADIELVKDKALNYIVKVEVTRRRSIMEKRMKDELKEINGKIYDIRYSLSERMEKGHEGVRALKESYIIDYAKELNDMGRYKDSAIEIIDEVFNKAIKAIDEGETLDSVASWFTSAWDNDMNIIIDKEIDIINKEGIKKQFDNILNKKDDNAYEDAVRFCKGEEDYSFCMAKSGFEEI